MSDNKKKIETYRCPLCFGAGNDVYLVQDTDVLRCLHCSYTGTEKEIEEMYADFKKRYRRMHERITLEMQREI